MLRVTVLLILLSPASSLLAATLNVPQDHKTIQQAIDAAGPGDTVLVAAGTYRRRLRMKSGVNLRSVGDDSPGKVGLNRAEATILDGGGDNGDQPGILMAEGSRLDGFTLTNVGVYQEKIWQKHFDTHGEELGDDEGAAQAEGTIPAISVQSVNCTVIHNIVHHNGDVGIAVVADEREGITPLVAHNICFRNMGGGIGVANHAAAIIKQNRCFENLRAGIGCRNAGPLIQENVCYKNVRAGIGCREGAAPIVRGNKCYQNRRAGIGIRMKETAPIVEENECYENEMAGIGSRDGAAPVIRRNQCYKNKMAGIGCDGSTPLIVGNVCRENAMAGIGLRGAAEAIILDNQCLENKLVALGVTAGSSAEVAGNRFMRTGGVPPIVAVKDGSTASIHNNRIENGGVAGILVQGKATIRENALQGAGARQGSAIWVWEGSTVTVATNRFDGYRAAVNASKSNAVVSDNQIRRFQETAIIVKDSTSPAHVFGNTAISSDAKAKAVQIQGATGIVERNQVTSESSKE